MNNLNKIFTIKLIKTNFCIVCFLFLTNTLFSQDCVLPNGHYRVEFDKQFENYSNFEFQIKSDSIVYFEENSKIYRKIERNEHCYLVFEKIEIDESNMSEVEKILNKQNPFYTFKKINHNTYDFIFRVDLHVMINSGKFILIDDEK